MKKTRTSLLISAFLLFTGNAIAQDPGMNNLSPEEQRMLLQLMLKQKLLGGGPPMATPPAVQPSGQPQAQFGTSPSKSEAELASELSQLPKLASGAKFERFRDGFSVNGIRYIDPEGTITAYGFDMLTGDFTYLAQTYSGGFVLKTGRANSNIDPITIGYAEKRGNMWSVNTVTGKKFSGFRLIPSSRGFIVARENTGFRYLPGTGTTSFAASEAFSIAAHQNGDIANTGYILLERKPDEQGRPGSVGNFISGMKALGSTLGLNKKEDYALLNIDNNKVVPINIAIDDKTVQVMSACRKRNNLMNECARMDSVESLYQINGSRNMTHYFWRISWFNTPKGRPVLISQEGGLSKIVATDLTSGKKALIFERALGIAAFETTQKTDGTISVVAQLGFSSETKTDILSILETAPAMPDDSSQEEGKQASVH